MTSRNLHNSVTATIVLVKIRKLVADQMINMTNN